MHDGPCGARGNAPQRRVPPTAAAEAGQDLLVSPGVFERYVTSFVACKVFDERLLGGIGALHSARTICNSKGCHANKHATVFSVPVNNSSNGSILACSGSCCSNLGNGSAGARVRVAGGRNLQFEGEQSGSCNMQSSSSH